MARRRSGRFQDDEAAEAVSADICAHTGRPVVLQRGDECLGCALAMFAGRNYDDLMSAAQRILPCYLAGAAMPHALMRRIAHDWEMALLSSIYMDWRHPGIVGVLSRTIENCGHALFWDGVRLIDPSGSGLYDRAYVDHCAVEFTQRAGDLSALIELDEEWRPAARQIDLVELF